jgi:hypothetical protein
VTFVWAHRWKKKLELVKSEQNHSARVQSDGYRDEMVRFMQRVQADVQTAVAALETEKHRLESIFEKKLEVCKKSMQVGLISSVIWI